MAGFNNVTDFYPQITGQLTVYPGPINQVTATVDNNVGTPHVDVQTEYTADGMNINFDFHDMGIPGTDLTVLQPLTEQQKANARQNINAQEVLTFDAAPTQGSQNPVTSGGVYAAEQAIASDVADIEAVIPAAATSQNQLADKEYVDDSINRSSAFFRGNFETRAALMAVPWQTTDPDAANYVSNNDYAYVADDETHDDESWRYIYVLEEGGSNNGWAAQYRVNESPLTTEQLAALNSGITSAGVAQIESNRTGLASHVADHSNPHQVTKAQVGLGNVDNTSDADKPISTAQQAALDALKDDIDSLYDPETASGDIVTIEDADPVLVDELVVDIQPVQDLHGQSAPYPAKGMGNYFDEDTLYASFKTGTNAFSGTASAINMVQFNIPQELVGQELTFSVHISSYAATSVRAYATAGGTGVNGNTGVAPFWSSVTFTPTSTSDKVQITYGSSGAGIIVFDSVQLEVGSSRTTWHPYSNECPISGWTGAKINVDGVNVWDEEYLLGSWSLSDGTFVSNNDRLCSKNKIAVKPNTTYYFKTRTGLVSGNVIYYAQDETFISSASNVGNQTFTTPSNCYFINISIGSAYGTTYNNDVGINYPATDTSYHSGTSNKSVDVSWTDEAGTVYGGTLTYLGSGKYSLQATRAKLTLDGSQTIANSTYGGTENKIARWNLPVSAPSGAATDSSGLAALCDTLAPTQRSYAGDFASWAADASRHNTFAITTNGTRIAIALNNNAITSDALMNAYLQANPITFAYDLATLPDPIILDAEDIELLEGTNNIFADAGPVTVKFAKGALAIALSKLTARVNALEAQA